MRPGDSKGSCLEGREQRLPILGGGWKEGGREVEVSGGIMNGWMTGWMDGVGRGGGGSGLVP